MNLCKAEVFVSSVLFTASMFILMSKPLGKILMTDAGGTQVNHSKTFTANINSALEIEMLHKCV